VSADGTGTGTGTGAGVSASAGASQDERLYFGDLPLDKTFVTSGRTITEADVVAFAGLSGDYNSLHVDETFAAST